MAQDFDDLPENRKPNPLPCGCGIMAVAGINLEGTKTEFRDRHIRFCPLHEAAADLIGVLTRLVRRIEQGERITPDLQVVIAAQQVIAKVGNRKTENVASI